MSETRFFDEGDVPIFTTPEWYATIERAPHLEQPGHLPRLQKASEFVEDAVYAGAMSVSDLGAGDGGLLALIDDLAPWGWGYDLIPANVHAAQSERFVNVALADFLVDKVRYGECVVLTEVLEHLLDPHGVLRDLPPGVRFVVASSPNGETWESRYEYHAYGWDMDGYRAMFIDAGWDVVRHEAIPGFQLVLAERP